MLVMRPLICGSGTTCRTGITARPVENWTCACSSARISSSISTRRRTSFSDRTSIPDLT